LESLVFSCVRFLYACLHVIHTVGIIHISL
jgi:hypothetical protein